MHIFKYTITSLSVSLSLPLSLYNIYVYIYIYIQPFKPCLMQSLILGNSLGEERCPRLCSRSSGCRLWPSTAREHAGGEDAVGHADDAEAIGGLTGVI